MANRPSGLKHADPPPSWVGSRVRGQNDVVLASEPKLQNESLCSLLLPSSFQLGFRPQPWSVTSPPSDSVADHAKKERNERPEVSLDESDGMGWCKDEECQRHVGGATGAEAAGMTHMGSGAEVG
ncbi:hypothetical protein F383_21145 [Gossypium arboreum]|uniref:Uncharacterized protein n=1 Tax=Gossypium arboreum TaxID=29729 RepID=A0A0B0NY34_GOSAR|nr:hypothetical protein F383_21145 [Gossypium arboreum]